MLLNENLTIYFNKRVCKTHEHFEMDKYVFATIPLVWNHGIKVWF